MNNEKWKKYFYTFYFLVLSLFTFPVFSKLYDSLLTLAYPQACQICQNSVEKSFNGIACEDCWKKSLVFSGDETLCRKCGRFLRDKPSAYETFCHRCDEDFYDFAAATGIYEFALAASVLNLKREPFISERLKKIFLIRFEKSEFFDASVIIPVPLSKKRELERGFNQAEVLAKFLSEKTEIKLDAKSLVRTIHTPIHRAGMDVKARQMSVKNAFEVRRKNLVKGEKILLVDDIFTSGATVSNCAKVLKENGADKVYVLTIARAK